MMEREAEEQRRVERGFRRGQSSPRDVVLKKKKKKF
jgi:hypothetical protein